MAAIALMGAGGKMGYRLARNLKDSRHELRCVEVNPAGLARLAELDLQSTPRERALEGAEVVILAVPDRLIGKIAHEIEPLLKPGTMVMALDPAAPHAGHLPKRSDVTYFVTHPCHPPVVNDEVAEEAKRDFFGMVAAKQNIVCALLQGPEERYALGEEIAKTMFAPTMRAHRITVEQMAILEPALAETVSGTLLMALREALDEAVRRGVPREAAFDFLFGHINVELAIAFQLVPGAVFSDAALKAIDRARPRILRDDWLKVFEPAEIAQSIDDMIL
jgi:D-apionate oxidoisomerase